MAENAKEKLIQELIDEGYLKTPRIIDAFRAIDRMDFVLPEYREEAYGNYPLPIGEGQTISQPLTVAFLLELLDPRPGEKILDVGSGSGWTTALLAHLVSQKENPESPISNPKQILSSKFQIPNGSVYGAERLPEICKFGQKNLAKYFDESRAKIICADGTLGFPEEAPYDKILAGASASHEIPPAWRNQLKIGGRIVAPIGGSIWLLLKKGENEWEEKEFPGFAFVPLVSDEKDKSKKIKDKKNPTFHAFILYPLSFILISAFLLANEIYLSHASFTGSKSVVIQRGLGSRKIAEVLKKEGVIRSKWAFITYVGLKGFASKLKPGSYVFSHRDPIPVIVDALARGGTNERVITIQEGWTVRDIAAYLERENILASESFTDLTRAKPGYPGLARVKRFTFLEDAPDQAGLEGYLFPDTYRIFADAKPEDIIVKMLENFERKITPEIRQEIARQNKTLFEIITMASLIEKEVPHDDDRAIVSGILWKRLKIGMALQVDATITYIKAQSTEHKTQNGRISIEDTKIDSPYNTYKYPGLPPGPIANPGLSAIKAAIYPKESPYLYYLSTPEGETVFSKTLEEHNKAKVKYLR